ncbi:MAG TPA: hypothetical protein VMW48_02345 [Vicinamibacterales bacterium]|nr:hypothetical protein [Vicinamibacterales bacterium]
MGRITSGQITAFFVFDVAEAVDLAAVRSRLGDAGQSARLSPWPAKPAYVQYQQPPVQVGAEGLGLPPFDGLQARFKIFDYGVVSLALARPFSGTWSDLAATASALQAASLEARAEAYCRQAATQLQDALQTPRDEFLSEDYVVYAVTALDPPMPADALVAAHGDDIARLLRGETEPLSTQERDEVLRHRLSYLASDLVVPAWNAAFVYDTELGLPGALEILEYANSQLLQYRYYDQRLDLELQRIYTRLQTARWYEPWIGRRYTAAARELHSVLIDVNELTDRTENALKLVGDVYAARLLGLATARLGLGAWKDAVRDKLKTLDDIYRFAVDQTTMDRGEVLEVAIVAILAFELLLFFMGIMT